ncbi:18758_t:CDS:2 [Racocetra fulgida]|uniref:18758_t:CDS:1 n=1 Tax=Racocetra fulgida TaxID=60492 RepID=A0A9N8ZI39_9GLOM|nr:18758_t:CDS:2 [Racocetra fulgida]
MISINHQNPNLFDYYSSSKIQNITKFVNTLIGTAKGEPKYGVISQFPVIDSFEDPINLRHYSSERSFEYFEVGYSKFGLKRYNITVELTASRRTGLHRYTFPQFKNITKVIIDLSHNLVTTSEYNGGSIQSISYNQVKGAGRYSGGWNRGGPYVVYFCSQFNTNAIEFETWRDRHIGRISEYSDGTTYFNSINVDQACKSAESEIPDWDFEKTKQEAVNAWQTELEKIDVDGGTDDLKTIFYTVDIVRSLIDIYQNEGYMPDGRSGLANGITQGGSNADMVVAEAYLKKLGTNVIDWDLAYEALIKDAEVDPGYRGLYEGRLHLTDYKEYGYIPFPGYVVVTYAHSPCSRTIEYSANDYSISLVAKGLGNYDDYMKYKLRARNVKRLIELSGGPKQFEKRLDKTFSNKTYLNEYFNIGNEPDFFHVCLYHFIGKQYKSVDVIRDILRTKYGSGQDGIPVTIKLSPQLTFTILAYNLTCETHVNPYVQSVRINGINWMKTWFRHSDIAKGAIMELFMGPNPSKVWGVVGEDEDKINIEDRVVPPSMSSIENNDEHANYIVADY